MAVLVTPSFYETNFSGSEPDEKRAIAKRFIYVIKEFDKKDKPLKYWAFFTSDEGKLRIWNAEKKSWKPVPIYPGTYHFYVTDSNTPIENPKLDLSKTMCGKPITISKEKNQQVKIPYLVTPTLYEINFSALNTGEKRKIENRYIYIVKEFDTDGKPQKYDEFLTSDEGKLGEGDPAKKSWKAVPISPGTYHFYVTDSNTPIKDPNLNLHKEMCGKPITVTNDKEQKIEIAYKDGDLYFTIYYQVGDDAFKKAAETWRKEKGLNNICTTTVCYLGIEVKTEPQFKKAWLDIYTKALAGHYRVMEGRLFTHASIHKNRDGLEFAGDPADPAADDPTSGETTLEKVEISNLEKLPWDRTGLLGLHGCNTGIERNGWSPAKTFCNSQKVRTFGQMGYAFFSENKDKFDRSDIILQDNDPRYLWAFKRTKNVKSGEKETNLKIQEKMYFPQK